MIEDGIREIILSYVCRFGYTFQFLQVPKIKILTFWKYIFAVKSLVKIAGSLGISISF
jgi:hypothetical protein